MYAKDNKKTVFFTLAFCILVIMTVQFLMLTFSQHEAESLKAENQSLENSLSETEEKVLVKMGTIKNAEGELTEYYLISLDSGLTWYQADSTQNGFENLRLWEATE